MSLLRLIARGLVHHRRMQGGLFAGVFISAAILTGALVVGDSVNHSLHSIALLRLGRIASAIHWPDRFFTASLAERLHQQNAALTPVATLALKGTASLPPGSEAPGGPLNRVHVIGVAADFWRLAGDIRPPVALGPQEAAINEKAARALGVGPGDDVTLRVVRPGRMALDAPLAARKEDELLSVLVSVKAVVSDKQLGRFSLEANQTAPYNVFVDRAWLQELVELPGMANLLLAGDEAPPEAAQQALAGAWDLEDLGLRLREADGVIQLESDSIFIDAEVVRAVGNMPGAQPTLTYLVNAIMNGERATPYSFVEAGAAPIDLTGNEVVINDWLAERLLLRAGDSITLAYYQVLPDNSFVEKRRAFTVKTVVPIAQLALARELAPQFPGLSNVEDCRDWNIGIPMDKERLNDPDNEAYWQQYGQTPKLLTNLPAGQEMWASRFGNVTAIRFPADRYTEADIRKLIADTVSPAKAGLAFVLVKKIALDAVAGANDFSVLFASLSGFLIIASLLLVGLLYAFGVQQRAAECGLLLALGLRRSAIRIVFLGEAVPAAIIGSATGAVAGTGYAAFLLLMIQQNWRGAVAGTAVSLHVAPATLALGIVATLACAMVVILIAVWRATRKTAHELLTVDWSSRLPDRSRSRQALSIAWPSVSMALALAIGGHTLVEQPAGAAESFFMSGALTLAAGLGFLWALLSFLQSKETFRRPRLWKIAMLNLARRRSRSLGVAGLTACGLFLVFSVASMQEDPASHGMARTSGTGGFPVYAETAAPLTGTAGDIAGQLGLPAVALRLRDGDDAGCLNLNRAQRPRLLGVSPQGMIRMQAFAPDDDVAGLWNLLNTPSTDGAVPVLAGDSNTAMWGLKKKIGDAIAYKDASGRDIPLRLVGQLPMRLSLFQGTLLMAEEAFTRLFPAEPGYRAFLIGDTGTNAADAAARLNSTFERVGMEAVPSVQRLQEFSSVEAAYLAMFFVLGGLGMVLGAAGTGVVALRNLFERRGELALFHALGFERRTVVTMFLIEQGLLLFLGITIGIVAAAASIVPLLVLSKTAIVPQIQGTLFLAILAANAAAIAAAILLGTPHNPLAAMQERD